MNTTKLVLHFSHLVRLDCFSNAIINELLRLISCFSWNMHKIRSFTEKLQKSPSTDAPRPPCLWWFTPWPPIASSGWGLCPDPQWPPVSGTPSKVPHWKFLAMPLPVIISTNIQTITLISLIQNRNLTKHLILETFKIHKVNLEINVNWRSSILCICLTIKPLIVKQIQTFGGSMA